MEISVARASLHDMLDDVLLGMGLIPARKTEKGHYCVAAWKFRPSRPDTQPLAVHVNDDGYLGVSGGDAESYKAATAAVKEMLSKQRQ